MPTVQNIVFDPDMAPSDGKMPTAQNTAIGGGVVIAGQRVATEVFHYEVAACLSEDAKHPSVRLAFEGVPIDKPHPENNEGCSLWPGSQVLGSYLLSEAGRALVKDKTVVELGCGVGLLGPVLILAGARHVILTDFNPHALKLAQLNMTRNQSAIAGAMGGEKMGTFSVQQLDWCQWGCEGNNLSGRAFDLAIASDVLYAPQIRQGLEQVLLGLTDRNPSCAVLLAAPFRNGARDAVDVQRDWLTSLSSEWNHSLNRASSGHRSPGPFSVESLTEAGPSDCFDVDGPTGMELWQALRSLQISPLYGCDPEPHLFRLSRLPANVLQHSSCK